MTGQQEIRFPLPDDINLEEVVAAIGDGQNLLEEPTGIVTRTFLDSFDWRLHADGIRLWTERSDGDNALRQNGVPGISATWRGAISGSTPRFSCDLPAGPVRDAASGLLDVRALLPQVEIKNRVRSLRLLDSVEKTVLRILVEQNSSRAPGKGKYWFCGYSIRLLPVRGYPKPFARVQKLLQQRFDLVVASVSVMDESLQSIGRRAGDYSSKLDFSFDPSLDAEQAARQIHLHLLDVIETNIPGVKADLDSEFLHDLRVAVRRGRSALSQVKGVFSDAELETFKSRLAWVGQVTGPTRDMDVFLLGFENYRTSLPERFREDLDPLHDFLVNHQKTEQRLLVKKINSSHFRTLLKEWREFLEASPELQDEPPVDAATPIAQLANRRIFKMFQRVLKEGMAIDDDSPAERLHDLRKDCKKLRYLMEFFQHLYPKKRIRRLISAIKDLLNNLGNFQDLEVQADKLREYARQMMEEGQAPHATLLAMGMLVDGLLRRQQLARQEFAERFARFARKENQRMFKSLFAPGVKKGKS
jgi:CHAD domain-containing protein